MNDNDADLLRREISKVLDKLGASVWGYSIKELKAILAERMVEERLAARRLSEQLWDRREPS